MAAAIGETLSPPRTDRQFALDQTKTRTSTPVEVLNVSVFDNPEGVPDPPPFARRPTVFSAVRPQRGLREGRSSKRFATTRRSRPRSTPCGRGREPEPRDRFICIRQIRAEWFRPKQSPGKPGRRRKVRRRHSSRQGIVTEGEDPSGASEAAAGGA